MNALILLITLCLTDGKNNDVVKVDTIIIQRQFTPAESHLIMIPDSESRKTESDTVIREQGNIHLQAAPSATKLQIVLENSRIVNSSLKSDTSLKMSNPQ